MEQQFLCLEIVQNYLRQNKTIPIVGIIVLAIVTYFFSYLVGLGYYYGAYLSGVAGYVGM